MGDLKGGVRISVEIAEGVDGEGEEDEAKHLSHGLPHVFVSQTGITGLSQLTLIQASGVRLLPNGGQWIVL